MSETIYLPDDALPSIEELSGDLRIVAKVIMKIVQNEKLAVRIALDLCEAFHGTAARLYGVRKFKLEQRNKMMRLEYDAGATGIQLARKYRLSERQVWNILGAAEPDTRQMSMFG